MGDEVRERYEATAGETPEATLKRFQKEPASALCQWVKACPGVGLILDWDPDGNSPSLLPISRHGDRVIAVARGYGAAGKPEDFLIVLLASVRP